MTYRAGIIVLGLAVACAVDVRAQHAPTDIVATIGGTPVTVAELDAALGAKLFKEQTDAYNVRRDALNEIVSTKLLEKTARARGVSVEALLRTEVEDKIAQPSVEELDTVYDSARDRFPNLSKDNAVARIRDGMLQQRRNKRREALIGELRKASDVTVRLAPPRMVVSTGDNPSIGPPDAPVTIVVFSDFQCQFCARLDESLIAITEKYQQRVRLVMRDFPLPIHPEAPKAAEAGECARDQGKYWEMHRVMLANHRTLEASRLPTYAKDAGLDVDRFKACLDSGAKAKQWQDDHRDGLGYGVSVTPAIFINGRLVLGAVPPEFLSELIDEELALALKTPMSAGR